MMNQQNGRIMIEKIIKERLKLKGITIRDLAKQIKVNESGLGRNLSGKSSMKLCTLYKVSKALGISWTDYEIK